MTGRRLHFIMTGTGYCLVCLAAMIMIVALASDLGQATYAESITLNDLSAPPGCCSQCERCCGKRAHK